MPFTVYLSSTLRDLEAERKAVQEALADQCVVRHSYRASEDALVESCLDDVAGCDLYIGILGLRYGHVPGRPFRNPKRLSITELEYRHAGAKAIPRHVFLKDENSIPYPQTDAKTKEHPPERIEAFRSSASGGDQRAAVFASIAELREHVIKAFNEFAQRKSGRPRAVSRPGRAARLPSNDATGRRARPRSPDATRRRAARAG